MRMLPTEHLRAGEWVGNPSTAHLPVHKNPRDWRTKVTLLERLMRPSKVVELAVVLTLVVAMILTPLGFSIREVVAGMIGWTSVLYLVAWIALHTRPARS